MGSRAHDKEEKSNPCQRVRQLVAMRRSRTYSSRVRSCGFGAEIESEERDRLENMQEKRYQGIGGGMNSSEQGGQPGTFIVDFGRPTLKLESKAGRCFPWSKHFITWAATSPSDDALTETSDSIISQGPHGMSRGELEIRHRSNKGASSRRAFEGITAAVTHTSPVLRKIQEIGSPSFAMAEN